MTCDDGWYFAKIQWIIIKLYAQKKGNEKKLHKKLYEFDTALNHQDYIW